MGSNLKDRIYVPITMSSLLVNPVSCALWPCCIQGSDDCFSLSWFPNQKQDAQMTDHSLECVSMSILNWITDLKFGKQSNQVETNLLPKLRLTCYPSWDWLVTQVETDLLPKLRLTCYPSWDWLVTQVENRVEKLGNGPSSIWSAGFRARRVSSRLHSTLCIQ